MRLLDLTLSSPAEDLALDEALFLEAEESQGPTETLRLWAPQTPFVVLGRSSQAEKEVKLDACRRRGVAVLRRISGGGTIVGGPGCLMYSLVLDGQTRPWARLVDAAHAGVLRALGEALAPQLPGAVQRGQSDLCLGERKFSGNSMKVGRRFVLYHGTIMHHFPLDLIEECLLLPPRQPDYRGDRKHLDFVMNVPLDVEAAKASLAAVWQATEIRAHWPSERVEQLVREKYRLDAWSLRH